MREAFINLLSCFGLGNWLNDGPIAQEEQNIVGESMSRGKMKNQFCS